MFATVPVGSIQPPMTPQASLHAGYLPDTAIGRLPHVSVPASVAVPEGNNNTKGGQTARTLAPPPDSPDAQAPLFSAGLPPPAKGAPGFGYSTPFLAQLLGQNAADRQIIVEYEQMVNFGNVKYMPSEALLPKSDPAGIFTKLLQGGEPAPQPPAPQAAARSIRMQAGQTAETRRAASGRNTAQAPVSFAASPTSTIPPKTTPLSPLPSLPRGPVSLIAPTGLEAYAATAARNETQLARRDTPRSI